MRSMRFPWSAPPPPPPPPPRLIDSTFAAIAAAVVSVVLAIVITVLVTRKKKKVKPVSSLRTCLDNEGAGPSTTMSTKGQLETTRSCSRRTPEPPDMAPTEEQASKRAALLERLAALPEHLRLGVTLPGMRELLSELPSDAVEQVNAKIPFDGVKGEPKYPKNDVENGYVNQFFVALWEKKDTLTVCQRLQKQGSPYVGEATVFVSWFLDTPIATLLDALVNFLKQQGLRKEDTFFWVCDYVIRQTNVKPDLARLGECVSAVGHTVLLMEPWHAPAPLKRAYCITEVYHTQKSGAQFDVVMSTAQQAAFEAALVDDFHSIQTSLSKVDVRTATCRKPEDTKAILDELEQDVGLVECNTLVIGLLREALVAQGRAALARLPADERGTSGLINNLGRLLQDMGQLKEARPLLEEAMPVRRGTLGDRHPDTLTSINNMGSLLRVMGQLEEARPLFEEALQARRETLGDRHSSTLISIGNMGNLLMDMGQLEEARPLLEEALQGRKETLGGRHHSTLISVGNMADLLRDTGALVEAEAVLGNSVGVAQEVFGMHHMRTLKITAIAAQLQHAQPGGVAAGKELLAATVARMAEMLGESHQYTSKYRKVLMVMEMELKKEEGLTPTRGAQGARCTLAQ